VTHFSHTAVIGCEQRLFQATAVLQDFKNLLFENYTDAQLD